MKKSEAIVQTVLDSGGTLFADQFKDSYFSPDGTGISVLKLGSKSFSEYLSQQIWKKDKSTVPGEAIKEALRTLGGIATNEGKQFPLNNRIARIDDTLFYDLGAGVIEISIEGWRENLNPPILFSRQAHQRPQIKPLNKGNPQRIFEFLNLADEQQKILFLINLAVTFIPNIPHPIFVFYGPQGAAKTTASRIIKDLVDPSFVETLTAPDSEKEFVQQCSHHAVLALDNLTFMPAWLSDALSRAVTGSAFSKRQLYSDDEDILYSFQRSLVLNGINLVIDKPDLMDRSILFELERISEKKRQDEKRFWNKFEEAKPEILGGIFNALSDALKEYDNLIVDRLPRMADFYKWGLALAEPLGFTTDQFKQAYQTSIDQLNDEAIEANPVGTAILDLILESSEWEGTPQELMVALNQRAEKLSIDQKNKYWPRDPRNVWKRLMRIKHNLQAKGIFLDKSHTENGSSIRIYKEESPDRQPSKEINYQENGEMDQIPF